MNINEINEQLHHIRELKNHSLALVAERMNDWHLLSRDLAYTNLVLAESNLLLALSNLEK